MSAPANPFDSLPIDPEMDPFSDTGDTESRTPMFRGRDLEEKPLGMSEDEILTLLGRYFDEAENARETGFEPRHDIWEQNLHAFWMRDEPEGKQDWQAREKSAMVPNFCERFAATHRRDLTSRPDWAEVTYRSDPSGALTAMGTRLTRVLLDFCGTNTSGHSVPFEAIFGNIVLTGALMKMVCSVTFDHRSGRVMVNQVDPRQCYWDPTGRGLYRVRFWEEDKESLLRKADQVDQNGDPLYDKEKIEQCIAHHDLREVQNKEDSSGQGQGLSSMRQPILVKEWLVDLIAMDPMTGQSKKVREKQLIVTANDQYIIRGPEPNPYWHGKDWVVGHSVLQAPLASVDGRTYVELFRDNVKTHENVTNRVLDLISSHMNAFEVNPDLLDDPDDLRQGMSPNKVLLRDMDAPPGERAVNVIEIGQKVQGDIMAVWRATKQESQEAAAQSDLSLGNTVQNGSTTATEVQAASQGASAMNDSISTDIDLNFLTPVVELVYYTGLQHLTEGLSPAIENAIPDDEMSAMVARQQEFRGRPMSIRAKGLTQAVERNRRLRAMMGAVNVIGSNQLLMAEFQKGYSMQRLLQVLLEDFGVDISRVKLTADEQARAIMPPPGTPLSMPAGLGGGEPVATNQNGLDPLQSGDGLSSEII